MIAQYSHNGKKDWCYVYRCWGWRELTITMSFNSYKKAKHLIQSWMVNKRGMSPSLILEEFVLCAIEQLGASGLSQAKVRDNRTSVLDKQWGGDQPRTQRVEKYKAMTSPYLQQFPTQFMDMRS